MDTTKNWRESGRVLNPGIREEFLRNAMHRCVKVTADGNNKAVGTGVVIKTGLVVANWHTIEDPEALAVTVNGHPADMIHWDWQFDLVALRCRTRRLKMVDFMTRLPEYGHPVFYAGNPDEWLKSVVEGSISQCRINSIRSSNSPSSGCSGSGLYSKDTGRLVGIVDAMDGTGDCFPFTVSVPARHVRDFVDQALNRLNRMPQVNVAKPASPQKRRPIQIVMDFSGP